MAFTPSTLASMPSATSMGSAPGANFTSTDEIWSVPTSRDCSARSGEKAIMARIPSMGTKIVRSIPMPVGSSTPATVKGVP